MTANLVKQELVKYSNKKKAILLSGYFKTGKGGYGEGDKFLGINVPIQRKIAQKFQALDLSEVSKLLEDNFHECRFTALTILAEQMNVAIKKQDVKLQKKIVDFYLRNIKHINNWDLVDTSAYKILGVYYFNKSRAVLFKLAHSNNLWKKRVAIIATAYFISQGDFTDTFKMAQKNIDDSRDLIQKATGWMLREIGKRNKSVLVKFLNQHAKAMPRTMLRYSLEHCSKQEKYKYM